MPNQTITSNAITVHGRGSLVLPYKVVDANKTQIDISDWTVFFEVDGVPIREQLVSDPADPLGLLLLLERDQIAILSKKPTRFALVDERRIAEGLPTVLWNGVISRSDYIGEPDATDDL